MKVLLVEKCDGCRNRVLLEETSWKKGIMTKVSNNECNQVIELSNKYGKTIETFPDIPLWCPLLDYKEVK